MTVIKIDDWEDDDTSGAAVVTEDVVTEDVVTEDVVAEGSSAIAIDDWDDPTKIDKTQVLPTEEELNKDPLFQDTEESMGREFMYGFQNTPTDVNNLALWLDSKFPMPGWAHKYSLPSEKGDDVFKSVETLFGEGFMEKSEDERREILLGYRRANIEREYPVLSKRGDDYERSWSEAIGSFVGLLTTPTSLFPIGKTYKAATTIGGVLGFSYGATEGLALEGEIDAGDTALYAAGGAVLAPSMITHQKKKSVYFLE